MNGPDFIEVYDGALDPVSCRALVDRFKACGLAERGRTGGGVDLTLKDSWDIGLDEHPEWSDAKQLLNDAVLGGLKRYLRRYAHAVLAPLHLKMQQPGGGAPVTVDAALVATLQDEMLTALIAKAFRPGGINLQRYVADQGGYQYWHSELYPKVDRGESLHRVLLWTTIYLNDGFEGGETEFLYQERGAQSRPEGRLPVDRSDSVHPYPPRKHSPGQRQVHRHELDAVPACRGPVRYAPTGTAVDRRE